jgi:cyclic-di-GMP phosphodiesterase TipF (flagellum assembly factor)
MLRLGAIFILVCMVLIAASLGALLYLVLGVSGSESTIVALAALTGLAIYSTVSARLRDRSDVGGQIADLSRGTADLARQVAELGRQIAEVEAHSDRILDDVNAKSQSASDPLGIDLGELGLLVRQLAETVAVHELKLVGLKEAVHAHDAVVDVLSTAATDAANAAAGEKAAAAGPPSKGRDELTAVVRSAVEASRADLYLQPIVTLPQRKVRYYEAFTRLRTEDGTLLPPSDFLDPAETGGLMPRIDNLMLLRSVQVLRRLQLKNRDIGLFCNIAASTLAEPQLFLQILQFMDANRALAPSLVLELKQSALRALGPIETESLSALRDLGFRFCMDQVTDLHMEPRDLGDRGIRYVKVPAPLLLDQASMPSSDIHAADLSDLLGRFGISLIAERIESEAQVVDLLEYDVRFGQGFLFSRPRPVRQEALRGPVAPAPSASRETEGREMAAAGGQAGLAL